jgi:hypothetical protein
MAALFCSTPVSRTIFLFRRDRSILVAFCVCSFYDFKSGDSDQKVDPSYRQDHPLILPFLVVPVFVALSKVAADNQNRQTGVLKNHSAR